MPSYCYVGGVNTRPVEDLVAALGADAAELVGVEVEQRPWRGPLVADDRRLEPVETAEADGAGWNTAARRTRPDGPRRLVAHHAATINQAGRTLRIDPGAALVTVAAA